MEQTTAPKLKNLTEKQKQDLLRRTFTEDPLAFTDAWEDGAAFRADLEAEYRSLPAAEAEDRKRRAALAAYYFNFTPGMLGFTYSNLDTFIEHANGEKSDVITDFDRVAQSFGVQQAKPEESQPGFFAGIGNYAAAASMMRPEYMVAANAAGISPEKQKQEFKKAVAEGDRAFANWETQPLPAAWKQDLTRLSGTVYNFLGILGRSAGQLSGAVNTVTGYNALRSSITGEQYPGAIELGRQTESNIRGIYVNRLEGARDSAAFVAANTGVPENWASDFSSASNWARNFAVSVIGSLPSTVANLGLAAIGGPASFGILYGTDGYYQAIDEGMSEEMAIGYGATIGLINGVGEIVTSKMLKVGGGKVNIQALQRDIARNMVYRVARHLTAGGLKEGGQEAAEQTAENLADMMFGRRGKITTENWKSELFRNVPEAFANAFATGFALEAGNYRAKQSFNQYKLKEYRNLQLIQRTIAELENKSGELSADEAELLQVLHIMNDAADPAKIARGAEMIQLYEVRHTIDQVRQRDTQTAPDMNVGTMAAENETEAIERSPEEQKQSADAARDLKLQRFLPHDVQDTENAVFDTMEKLGYTGEVVVMKTGWDEELLQLIRGRVPELAGLPADLEKSVLGKMFPAFYHNGKVYINAQTVRPSEIPRVLAHEIGIHAGIRKAFSKDLNTLLDWVYDANFNTPEMARIIEAYHLAEAEVDEEGNPLFDGEGNQIFKELSEENRRIAAEELLADLAETGGMNYRKVYAENEVDIAAFAKENNIDIHNLADRRQLVKDWASATGYTVQKPNWFKQLISNIRIWMHNHGLPLKNLSDDDIANIIFRSAKAARARRKAAAENTANGEGTRFSIIGEAGARALDLYLKQNNMDNLNIAREMLNAGKDAKTIKLATGWEKGGDGKWRMEIPDIEMKKTQSFLGKEEKIHPPVKLSNYLDQIIDAPELFAAYPEAKNIIVRVTDELPKNVGGRYVPAQKRILIKDSLTELQLDQIRRQNRKIQRAENWTESDTKTAQMLGLETDPVKVKEDAQKVLDLIVNAQLYEYRLTLIHEIQHFIQDQEGFAKGGNSQVSGFEKYKHLGGEVEARNAAQRSRMSMVERRSSLLSETEDVAEESKIYLFDNDGTSELAAALRRYGDPNNAEQKGKLVDGNVPHISGFMEWAGLKGKNLYADYEFLYSRHHKYFNSPEEVKAAVELVLAKPEQVKDKDHNISFVGFDEVTGDIYRIEINPNITGRANHVRSVFKITAQNYNDIKLEPQRVLQPSKTALQNGRAATITLSSFMNNNISQNPENASSTDKNGPSAAPDGAMEGKRTGTDKSDGNGALFTLNSNASEELKRQVKAMQACVGPFLDQDGAEYARRFKEKYGITIDPDEAKVIAALAISENKSAHQKQVAADNSLRAWEYFKSYNPLFDFMVNYAGDNFKINPGKDFAGDEFTGTFIVKEFRDYSVKRRQKPHESDAAYRKYLDKREKALSKVSGTPLDEVAQAYARESGRELNDVQEEIIDLLRNLQRTDIISQYKKYKDDLLAADNAELEALRRATEDHQRRRIEEEAATVIQSQSVIDADWAKANSKVYIKLQELLFPGQSPTPHPSQSRIEEINAAIYSTKGDASGFIEGFRAGREAAYNKYAKELKAFREKLRSADADRVSIAREADALLRQLLPPEHYSKFARRVIGLRDITNEKARLEAFDKLKSDILAYADIVARDRNLEQFHTRLNQLGRRSDTGRKAIGVRDEATQRQLDQIRKYALMSAAELAELVDNLQTKIEISENNSADEEISLHLALQFGAIDGKSLQEIITAREQLEELARSGKDKFNAALSARAAADEAMRQQIIIAVNGNNAVLSPFERQKRKNAEATQSTLAKYIKAGVWENLNLWGMFDLLDANSLGVFDKLAADTHTAARNEDSMNFRNADDLSRKINSLIGSNSPIERAGRILQWRKIQDKTGVFRLKHKDDAKRRFKYTYYELSQARYLLEEYDKNPSESILQDYQAEAIRHQLANFDNHVRKDDKSSFNDGVTEKLEKLAKEEEDKRAYDGKPKESLVCIPTPDFSEAIRGEMPLSQMQALSLWLYSKQPTVNYKLHFNGIDNNTLKQLENFLLPEVKELGLWMVKQLEDDRKAIGEVYEKLYFTAFPSEEHYFPAVFEHIKTVGGKSNVDITQEGSGAKPMAYTPGALKQRVFHLGEPVTADALTVFQNHRMMMNHFVTHGETTRQLRAIFNNHDVRQAIIDQHGTLAYKSLVDQLEAFVQGGNINADANRFYQAVYGAWVRSKMAGNLVSGIKQSLGFITYGQEIPAAALAKGAGYALRHPGEVLNILRQSDYFNNRLRQGANMELRLLLDMSGQTAGKVKAYARKFDEILSYALRFGDAASVLLGGYATYKYHHDNLVARGVSESEAHKQALLEMEMATERTQQSSKPHMLNAAQRSSLRAFTAFKSNQILLMNKLLPAILKRDGKQIKASLGALAVSSVVMTAVGNLLRKGIDFDEYEWLDYIENFAADAMSGYGFSGALGSEIIGGVLSEIKNKKFRFRGSDPLTDIGNTVFSIADMPEHLEEDDYDKVFGDVQKILTGVGMLADAVTPGNFVSNTAAVVREARRWWRLITGANKRKPKRKKSWF